METAAFKKLHKLLQGTGANGKSVIYRVLKDMFGEDEILNIKMSQFARGGDEQLRAAYSLNCIHALNPELTPQIPAENGTYQHYAIHSGILPAADVHF